MEKNEIHSRSVASIEPLLRFWENNLVPECSHMASVYKDLKEKVNQTPELQGEIEDLDVFKNHKDILTPLMSAIFPPASFHSEIAAALTPYTLEPLFATPKYQELIADTTSSIKGQFNNEKTSSGNNWLLQSYFLVLDKVYNIRKEKEKPIIQSVEDKETGLDTFYRIVPDFQFIDVKTLGEPRKLNGEERATIIENITNTEILATFIDFSKFLFSGFTVARAIDITEPEVISDLEKDLIDQHSIFSSIGIKRLENRLRALFRRPGLMIGIGALQGDQVMIVKSDCNSNVNCLFFNSQHVALDDLAGSVWLKAGEDGKIVRIPDFKELPDPVLAEQQASSVGIRSMLISPLSYQDENIGILEIFSTKPHDFSASDEMMLGQITPLFSVALKRGLDELGKTIQSIIKEKCTAVHPSVEWRFQQVAIKHMERLRFGTASEMEPIIFKDVVPLFGQSDIRGSSLARNKGIQQDLTKQLCFALDVMDTASNKRPWPLLEEYKYRIQKKIEDIATEINSGDEVATCAFLNNEVTPTFESLKGLGPDVIKSIEKYYDALDPVAGVVYDKRKEYEDSVSKLNETLSSYLAKEDALIQESFPHYFEKRQTDGIDYMMYVGASMAESGVLAPFHIKNLTLWQMILSCGLAWHAEHIKPELEVPLDICHLILINHTPLSIRFRFDEKRFDVDGAYDVRHEIIKSRLDKALIKGTGDRLTQPGRIAVVYSNPEEGRQIQQHVDFMTSQGKLNNDLEVLELDDMPDVKGLKAFRVGVNLESVPKSNIIEMKAG